MGASPAEAGEARDHFALFGLPRRLELDAGLLARRFLELSREHHPDRHAGVDPAAAASIQRNSARVNDAHRTLREPVARAEYLLDLEGIERPANCPKCPADLLTAVFAMRERHAEGDTEGLTEEARDLLAAAEAQQADLFFAHDRAEDEDARRAALTELRAVLDRRKFLANLVRDFEAAPGS